MENRSDKPLIIDECKKFCLYFDKNYGNFTLKELLKQNLINII